MRARRGRLLSAHDDPAENPWPTKHVVIGGELVRDAGSTPAASTNWIQPIGATFQPRRPQARSGGCCSALRHMGVHDAHPPRAQPLPHPSPSRHPYDRSRLSWVHPASGNAGHCLTHPRMPVGLCSVTAPSRSAVRCAPVKGAGILSRVRGFRLGHSVSALLTDPYGDATEGAPRPVMKGMHHPPIQAFRFEHRLSVGDLNRWIHPVFQISSRILLPRAFAFPDTGERGHAFRR